MIKGRMYIEDFSDCLDLQLQHDIQGYYIDFYFKTGEQYEEYRRKISSEGIKIIATYLF